MSILVNLGDEFTREFLSRETEGLWSVIICTSLLHVKCLKWVTANKRPKSSHSMFEQFDSVVERVLFACEMGLKFVGISLPDFESFLMILSSCSIRAPMPFLDVSTSMYSGLLAS